MAKKFKMTKEKLRDLAATDRKIDSVTLEMLERVLVNGESQRAVAEAYGAKQQFISDRVRNIYERVSNQAKHIPDGFELRSILVHKDGLDTLHKFEKDGLVKQLSKQLV